MRKKLATTLMAVSVLGVGGCGKKKAPPPPPPQIEFAPSVATAPAGSISLQDSASNASSLSLDIVATGLSDVSTLYFDLVFNPAVVSYTGTDRGPLFTAANIRFLSELDQRPGITGRLVVGIATLPDTTGVTGTGVIGTVHLSRVAAGTTGIQFESFGSTAPGGTTIAGLGYYGGRITVR